MVTVMARQKVEIQKLAELAIVEPFFGDKKIKKELGLNICDRGYQWFAALFDGKVAGFVSVASIKNGTFPFKGSGVELKHFYVLPEYRGKGIGKKLMQGILEQYQRPIKATVTPESKPFYERFGFEQVFQYGKYPLMYKK